MKTEPGLPALGVAGSLASEFMSNDILKDLEKLVDGVKATLENAKAREAAFSEWYGKLMVAMPALSRKSITLTSDNFRKAMRQAYRAGNAEANINADPREGQSHE